MFSVAAKLERVRWEKMDNNAKRALRAIRELIDYLDGVKKELCLESTRLSSEETLEYVGPAAKVAVAGLVHAINFLAVCRTGIQETDLVLAKRSLLELERTS